MKAYQAILRGQLIIMLPFFPVVFLAGGLTFLVFHILGLPFYIGLLFGILIGCSSGLAWMAWRIPIWRIWALQNVTNLEDLLPKAVAAGIMGNPGSFSSRLEFKSKEQIALEQALTPVRSGPRKVYLESRPYQYDYDGESFCFWARPWVYWPTTLSSFNPQFMFCQVNSERIEVESKGEKISIQLAHITELEERQATARFHTGEESQAWHIGITFSRCKMLGRVLPDLNQIYIAPIHPLGHMGYRPESDALMETINAFRSNTLPTIAKSPYQRQLTREGSEDENDSHEWIPFYPPSAYTYIPKFMDFAPGFLLLFIPFGLLFGIISIFEAWFTQ